MNQSIKLTIKRSIYGGVFALCVLIVTFVFEILRIFHLLHDPLNVVYGGLLLFEIFVLMIFFSGFIATAQIFESKELRRSSLANILVIGVFNSVLTWQSVMHREDNLLIIILGFLSLIILIWFGFALKRLNTGSNRFAYKTGFITVIGGILLATIFFAIIGIPFIIVAYIMYIKLLRAVLEEKIVLPISHSEQNAQIFQIKQVLPLDSGVYLKQQKIKGWYIILIPFFLFLVSFILSTVLFWVIGLFENGETMLTFVKIVNVLLGITLVLGLSGTMICLPIGIGYINQKENDILCSHDKRSGMGKASEIPKELHGWNWGAFGLQWIWGGYFRVWKAFWMFVPIVNILWLIVLGIRGNKWAWQARKWKSVEDFLRIQHKWRIWGIAWFVLYVFFIIMSMTFRN